MSLNVSLRLLGNGAVIRRSFYTAAGAVGPLQASGGKFRLVAKPDQRLDFTSISDKAASSVFWTELLKGFSVTLSQMLKVKALLFVLLFVFP